MNERIEVNPNICHGQPCIKGTRIMVYSIIELLETGLIPDDIIKDYYPNISKNDIKDIQESGLYQITDDKIAAKNNHTRTSHKHCPF